MTTKVIFCSVKLYAIYYMLKIVYSQTGLQSKWSTVKLVYSEVYRFKNGLRGLQIPEWSAVKMVF